MQDEIQKLIGKTEEGIRQLSKPPSKDAVTEILHLIADFIRDLSLCVEGTPEADGLMQAIRPHQITFKEAVRATAPDFQPSCSATTSLPFREDVADTEAFGFWSNEEGHEKLTAGDSRSTIYIDDVMNRLNR